MCLTITTPHYSYAYPLREHQIGVSPATVTNILQLPKNSQPLTYKYYTNSHHAFRLGVDGIFESEEGGEQRLNLVLGYERYKVIDSVIYSLGFVFDFQHQGRVDIARYYNRYGISPVVSATVLLSNTISLSTEVKLDFLYHLHIDNDAFLNSSQTSDQFTVSMGSLGLLLVNFHI
jgi:hypothetical protein